MKSRLLFLLLLAVLVSPCRAQESFEPEFAKLNTSDASALDPGDWEIAFGYDFVRSTRFFDAEGEAQDGKGSTERSLGFGLTAGLLNGFDFTLGVGLAANDTPGEDPAVGSGMTDLELAVRWKAASGENWAFALLPSVVLPTGSGPNDEDAGVTQDFTSLGLSAVVQAASGRIPLNFEAGYSIGVGDEAEGYNGTLILNAAAGWHAAPSFLPIVEVNYTRDQFEGVDASQAIALSAGLFIPTENAGRFQVGVDHIVWGRDAGIGTGLHLAWIYGFSTGK
jgi:hypothetical protein